MVGNTDSLYAVAYYLAHANIREVKHPVQVILLAHRNTVLILGKLNWHGVQNAVSWEVNSSVMFKIGSETCPNHFRYLVFVMIPRLSKFNKNYGLPMLNYKASETGLAGVDIFHIIYHLSCRRHPRQQCRCIVPSKAEIEFLSIQIVVNKITLTWIYRLLKWVRQFFISWIYSPCQFSFNSMNFRYFHPCGIIVSK